MNKVVRTIALVSLLAATVLDLIVPFIIGTRYPGYSHLTNTISSLGTNISPVQWYENLTLILVGILFIVFAASQWNLFEQRRWAHNLYSFGILAFGIGTLIAGIFPDDPHGVTETVSGKIHGIASAFGFIFLILNPLWTIWMKELSRLKTINILLFIMAVLTFTLFILSEETTAGVLKYTGLFQRLNMVVLYGMLILNYVYAWNRLKA